MRRLLPFALLVPLAVAASCRSVPLSTMARLGGMDRGDVAALPGDELRLRVKVPKGFAIDPGRTELRMRVALEGGTVVDGVFPVEPIGAVADERLGGGLFTRAVDVRTTTLRLADAGVRRFVEVQAALRSRAVDGVEFSVASNFLERPPGADRVRLWADLRLAAGDDWFTLVDGADVALPPEGAGEAPP